MARTKISEFSATANSNTDINSINIAEGCAPSNINDAIRELMAELKDFQAGTKGDSFNGPVGTSTAAAGAFTTLSASSTVSGTGFSTYLASPPAIGGTAAAAGSFTTLSSTGNTTLGDASGDTVTINGTTTFANVNPTLSAGTANGVLYLNGSKVATSGSALTFDGTSNFSYGGSNASIYNTFNVNNTASNGYSRILFNIGASGANGIGAIKYAPGIFFAIGTDSDSSSTPIVFNLNNSEQMRLTSTGLGIGTSTPSTKLDVQGGAQANTGILLRLSSQSSGVASKTQYTDGNTYNLTFGSNGTGNFVWSTGEYATTLGTERMRLDSSGNLGLGVTPSAWATYKAFSVGNSGNSVAGTGTEIHLTANCYYNAGWKYNTTERAARFSIGENYNDFKWYIAASGTAGNAITFTQAMTLDASGNLGVGTTSTSYIFQVSKNNTVLWTDCQSTYVEQSTVGSSGANIDWYQSTKGTGSIIWRTNGTTERARIDSSGNLLVGKTSTSDGVAGFAYQPARDGAGHPRLTISDDGSTNSYAPLLVYSVGASAARFYVGAGGTVYATSTTITAISDQRLKENIQDLDVGLEKIMALKPRKFDWKAGKGKDKKGDRGWIAQEFEQVFPDMIDTWADPAPEGEEPYKAVNADLIPVLVKAIQELKAEFDAYKATHP